MLLMDFSLAKLVKKSEYFLVFPLKGNRVVTQFDSGVLYEQKLCFALVGSQLFSHMVNSAMNNNRISVILLKLHT